MAALDTVGSTSGISTALIAVLKGELWSWINANQDVKVLTVKWWIVSKTFYVRDLDAFAELLLGPRPA